MTEVRTVAARDRRTPQPDLRRVSRIVAAVVLPAGPLAVALLRFVLPYTAADSSAEVARQVEAHPTAQSAAVWLGYAACLALVPGVIFAGRVVGRAQPRLAAVATPMLVLGYLSLPWLVVADAYVLFGVSEGLPGGMVAQLYAGVHPAATVAAVLFVVGHVLGTVLLGVAMLRGRVVPVWAAIATIVAQPAHFVATMLLGSPTLDLFAWGLNAAGFAALSVVVLRLADDEWAPAGTPRGATV